MLIRKGLSIIELLISFALISVLLATTVSLLYSSLRSAKKADAVGSAKAEGYAAIGAITNIVRYADQIVSCQPNALHIKRLGYHQDPPPAPLLPTPIPRPEIHDVYYFAKQVGGVWAVASASGSLGYGNRTGGDPVPANLFYYPLTSPSVTLSGCGAVTNPPSLFTCPTPVNATSVGVCFQLTTAGTTNRLENSTNRFDTTITLRNCNN